MESVVSRRIIKIVCGVALVLLIPLIAMQFSQEVNWSVFDFMVAAFLLLATALTLEWLTRKFKHTTYKWLWIIVVCLVLLLLWAELAVGIFGSPLAGS
ncbi:MAG: hypothetical protein ABNH00_04655 [Dokdonia sp.]|jgi:uncharacterized membrane protein|nr:hypothetical protein [Cytophagaceae bacterium]